MDLQQLMSSSNRIRVGLLAFFVLFSVTWLGGWVFSLFVGLIFLMSFQELNGIFRAKNIQPSQVIVLTTGILMLLAASFGRTHFFLPILTLGILAGFIRLLFRHPRASIHDIGATFLAIFYVGFLPMHFILLRNLGTAPGDISFNPIKDAGFGYMMLTFLVITSSDVGSYYAGKLFGKTLLYPEVSPKKTREGAFGGLLFGCFMGILFTQFQGLALPHAVVLSLLIIIAAQLGDLFESLLKRDAGVKDSGKLLLGHGGLLDRMDSFIFSGVVSYYYIYWVILAQGMAQDIQPFLHSLNGLFNR